MNVPPTTFEPKHIAMLCVSFPFQPLRHALSYPLSHPLSHPLRHPLGHTLRHPLKLTIEKCNESTKPLRLQCLPLSPPLSTHCRSYELGFAYRRQAIFQLQTYKYSSLVGDLKTVVGAARDVDLWHAHDSNNTHRITCCHIVLQAIVSHGKGPPKTSVGAEGRMRLKGFCF